jgi:hypothetical protein
MNKRTELYLKTLYSARNVIVSSVLSELERRLIFQYLFQISEIAESLERGTIKLSEVDVLINQIKNSINTFYAKIEPETKKAIIETLDYVERIHTTALKALIADEKLKVAFSFTGMKTDAFNNMFLKRGLNIVKSYVSVTKRNGSKEMVFQLERAIEESIRSGASWKKTQAEMARILAIGNDSIQEALKQVQDRKTFSIKSFKGLDDETYKGIKTLLFDARRIANTEVLTAIHEGELEAARRNPIIKSIKWTLSGRHNALSSSPDICDVYANADLYKLGAGQFYPDNAPSKPHPNCGCGREFILRPFLEINKPKPAPKAPGTISGLKVEEYLTENVNDYSRKISAKFVEFTTKEVNAQTKLAEKLYKARQKAEKKTGS